LPADSPAFRMRSLNPVLTLVAVLVLVATAYATLPRGYAAGRLLAVQDDPVGLSQLLLANRLDAESVTDEIHRALAAGDSELATSFVELARDRGLALDPAVVAKADAERQASQTTTHQLRGFARGFVTGEADSAAALAGTAFGDLFIFGDLRDATREGLHALQGHPVDTMILGLSAAGLAVTAGTYASIGIGAPARIGLSVLKAARKAQRLGTGLVARLTKTATIVRVAEDLGRVQAKAGTRAAVEGLRLAEGPKDLERLARLAEGEGTKTRAVIKLLGRGALALTAGAFQLASWAFWAIANVFGLCAVVKRGAERATLAFIRHRRRRRQRRLHRAPVNAIPADVSLLA
jgi:hypothetical protein